MSGDALRNGRVNTNPFGFDATALDLQQFLRWNHAAFVALALVLLWFAYRRDRPLWLLGGACAANAYVWWITNFPLAGVYGLRPSSDRVNNVGLCQVVAVGGRPWETTQVGQLQFEPLWGALVAALSGFDPERLLGLYPFLSLAVVLGTVLAFYAALGAVESPDRWSAWERALAAGSATLLCSAPFDYTTGLRVPWAQTFLLKPNHALGFVVFAWFVYRFARIRSLKGALGAGLVLHLLGWVFVLHMVFTCAGLVVFALSSLRARSTTRTRDAKDASIAVGVNLLVVSPYLFMLFYGYPFLVRSSSATIPAASPHLLEPSAWVASIFTLALWGAWAAVHRGDRVGRLVASVWSAALLIWVAFLVLGAVELARERDDLYYWIRVLTALLAAVGAFDMLRRLGVTGALPFASARAGACALTLAALPYTIAYWWNPVTMDLSFLGSRTPLSSSLVEVGNYLRQHAAPTDVIAGDPNVVRYAAALSGRRGWIVLGMNAPADFADRSALTANLLRGTDPEVAFASAVANRIRYVAVTPAYLAGIPAASLAGLDAQPHLRRVDFAADVDGEYVALYEVGAR